MSAWIPSKPHVDAMLAEAVIRGVVGEDYVAEAGWDLTREVVASVAYRYERDPSLDTLPGARPPWWIEYTGVERPVPKAPLTPYVHEPVNRRLTDVELLSAVECFDYQACEHPAWERSAAYQLCSALIAKVVEATRLPSEGLADNPAQATLNRLHETREWHRAPWGFEADDLNGGGVKYTPIPHEIIVVSTIPPCNFCKDGTPGPYDFATRMGPWANGCEEHYHEFRAADSLGTGKGQLWITEDQRA